MQTIILTLLFVFLLFGFKNTFKRIAKAIRDNDQKIHDEFTKLDNNK